MLSVTMISDLTFLTYLASALIREAYESAPTRVTRASTRPESRKLPLMSSEPASLVTGLLSPVRRLSLRPASPQMTSASAGTWSPRRSTRTSSSTTSSSAT